MRRAAAQSRDGLSDIRPGRVPLWMNYPALETLGYFRMSPRTSRIYFVENLKTVFSWKVSPGFKIVLGKSGWLGESGKCWVSRQRP